MKQIDLLEERRRLSEEQKRVAKEQRVARKKIIKSGRKIISKELKLEIPEEIRSQIERKYNHKCAICKKRSGKMQIHHVNLNNEDNNLMNLEVLCQKHHLEKHTSK